MNASESVECETPGASVRLVGRCDSTCTHGSNNDGGAGGHRGVRRNWSRGAFVADADEVEIRARSAAGVKIVVDAVVEEDGGKRNAGDDGGDETVGGRLEVRGFLCRRVLITGNHTERGNVPILFLLRSTMMSFSLQQYFCLNVEFEGKKKTTSRKRAENTTFFCFLYGFDNGSR